MSGVVIHFLYCNEYCVSANVIHFFNVVPYIICLQLLFNHFIVAYNMSAVVIQFLQL
jgi:hypothetical protein